MLLVRSLSLVPCFVLAVTASAWCQQPVRLGPPPAPQQGYIAAFAGATVEDAKAATFAGEFGDNIHRDAQAYATLTYFDDVMTRNLRNDLTLLGDALSAVTGSSWQLHGRDRAIAFSAGVKYLAPIHPAVRPYVGGGAGVINVERIITERTLGDVTGEVIGGFGVSDGLISAAQTNRTRPIAEGVAGISIVAGRAYIDVGYRFRRVLLTSETFDFSQFCVGFGMRF